MQRGKAGPAGGATGPGRTPPGARCAADEDLRCGCGSLIAIRTPGGIEIKCRRCRRVLLVAPDGPAPDAGLPLR